MDALAGGIGMVVITFVLFVIACNVAVWVFDKIINIWEKG